MYYKWYAWWRNMGTWDEAKVVKKVDGKNEWVYEQQSAAYQCKGKTKTTFSSSTLAGIVWGGKKLYARVYSKVIEKYCTV